MTWSDLRVAWVAENPTAGVSRPGGFAVCLLVGDAIAGEQDGFPDADSAVRWARERAAIVMLRKAGEPNYASVGSEAPPWPEAARGDQPVRDGSPAQGEWGWAGTWVDGQWVEPSRRSRRRMPSGAVPPAESGDEAAEASVVPFPPWDRDQD